MYTFLLLILNYCKTYTHFPTDGIHLTSQILCQGKVSFTIYKMILELKQAAHN